MINMNQQAKDQVLNLTRAAYACPPQRRAACLRV